MKKILLILALFLSYQSDAQINLSRSVQKLGNGRLDTLAVREACTYSDITISHNIGSTGTYLIDTELSNSQVDQLLVDYAAANDSNGDLWIIGDNGYPTATSIAARTTLDGLGWNLVYNAVPIDTIYYSNTGQTITEGVTGTNMALTIEPTPDDFTVEELADDLPAGITINTTTGLITVDPDAGTAGDYAIAVRVRAYGTTYTGFADAVIYITVEAAPIPDPIRHNIAFTNSTLTLFTDDPFSKYWNNAIAANLNGTISNIVDEDNNVTAIDVTTSGFLSANNVQGYNPADGVYPDPAWRHNYLLNASGATIVFGGLDDGLTYDIVFGSSRNTSTGTRVGEITIGGSMQSLNSELNPPQTRTWTGVSPTSNAITVTINLAAGSSSFPASFVTITSN